MVRRAGSVDCVTGSFQCLTSVKIVDDDTRQVDLDVPVLADCGEQLGPMVIEHCEEVAGGDVSAGDMKKSPWEPAEQVCYPEVIVLSHHEATLGITQSGNLGVRQGGTAQVVLDVARVVTVLDQVVGERLG